MTVDRPGEIVRTNRTAKTCSGPQSCCQGLLTQGQGQGQGLDVQGLGQVQGQGLTPALIHTWFSMCNMKNNTFKTLFFLKVI